MMPWSGLSVISDVAANIFAAFVLILIILLGLSRAHMPSGGVDTPAAAIEATRDLRTVERTPLRAGEMVEMLRRERGGRVLLIDLFESRIEVAAPGAGTPIEFDTRRGSARLALARAYPFAFPDHSLLFEDGRTRPLADPAPHLAGRTAVLAVGSNQSPEQLARKFAHLPGSVIPLTRVWLDDFDVVYATHVTRYGSIPGNLHACPGARVRLSVTWLDEAQLAVMHATEIAGENYVFARLDGVKLAVDGGMDLESVHAYVSLHGSLSHDGAPVGLAAIRTERRPHAALSQEAEVGVKWMWKRG